MKRIVQIRKEVLRVMAIRRPYYNIYFNCLLFDLLETNLSASPVFVPAIYPSFNITHECTMCAKKHDWTFDTPALDNVSNAKKTILVDGFCTGKMC